MLKDTYNERLFQRRFRRFLHIGRFQWLARRVASHDPAAETIVELGCYDGRVLEHLDHKPKRYVGYDANWERGLDLARARWSGHPEYEFRMVVAASDVNLEERFDIGVCMETLEHLPPEAVDGYIDALAAIVQRRLYVTIPNEKYAVFLAKYAYHVFVPGGQPHSVTDFVNALLGRTDRIEWDGHKGFDYAAMIRRLERRFIIESVEGQPIPELPAWMSMGVAIRAIPRSTQ